tara:strand:+ start:27 stop:341 length:315 start_codon:yes stop_codon:yes gene_type:complete
MKKLLRWLITLKTLVVQTVKQINKNMRSNSPFRQDKCATGWAKLKERYMKKKDGAAEYKREKPEYHCNESTGYKVKIKQTDDAEMPTDQKERFGDSKKKSIMEK